MVKTRPRSVASLFVPPCQVGKVFSSKRGGCLHIDGNALPAGTGPANSTQATQPSKKRRRVDRIGLSSKFGAGEGYLAYWKPASCNNGNVATTPGVRTVSGI